MTILLVEDSRFLRISTERALIRAGHRVISVGDGKEALRVASENRPDLILLDMMLPKMTGPEVLETLKRNSATTHIPAGKQNATRSVFRTRRKVGADQPKDSVQ